MHLMKKTQQVFNVWTLQHFSRYSGNVSVLELKDVFLFKDISQLVFEMHLYFLSLFEYTVSWAPTK